jgi:hypothetical protein
MRKVLICVFLLGLGFVAGLEYNRSSELGLPEYGFITRSEALAAINNSEAIIEKMRLNNFSVVGVSRDLDKAGEVLQLVDYSEVLRNGSASAEKRIEAVKAIGDRDWSYFDYGDVLDYTDAIAAVGKKAFLSYSSLISAKVVYEKYSAVEDVDSTLLERAEDAFYRERYDEAENFALIAKDRIESGVANISTSDKLKDFFVKYGVYVFALVILLVVIFYRVAWGFGE